MGLFVKFMKSKIKIFDLFFKFTSFLVTYVWFSVIYIQIEMVNLWFLFKRKKFKWKLNILS